MKANTFPNQFQSKFQTETIPKNDENINQYPKQCMQIMNKMKRAVSSDLISLSLLKIVNFQTRNKPQSTSGT